MMRREFLKSFLAVPAAAALSAPAYGHGDGARSAAAFDRRRQFVDTRFGRIAFVEAGDGPRAALFLHGWPLNGYHWRGSLAALSGHRRCIAPDFMGLGHSEVAEDQDLSPAAQAEMIAAFMDAVGIGQADLVANDSGTAVAQLLAARHPARVRSLLLTNGDVHTNSPPEALKPAIEAARRGELAGLIERHLADPGFAASPQGLGFICYTDPESLTPEAMHVYFRPLLASPVRRRQFQLYGVAFEPNPLPAIEPLLRRLQIPARMVWGTGDVHFRPEWAAWLDEALPLSRGVRLIDGAKLFFTEERVDVVVEEALRLWEEN